jgi:hypothetical protein
MRRYDPSRDEHLRRLARERTVVGDLLTFDAAVVPIKTRGRWYGSISRAVANQGVSFPDLALGCAELVVMASGRTLIFVALWSDDSTYSPTLIYNCTAACLKQASLHRVPKIALPLLGGNQRHRFTGAMEQAVDDAMDEADEKNEHMPEVVFVTDVELP